MIKSRAQGVSLFLAGLLGAYGVGMYGMGDVSDYEQAVAYEAYYCSMVEKRMWPATPEHPCPGFAVEPGSKLAGL